jgi:hypothetical protein
MNKLFELVSESTNPTSRDDFWESWLLEMPVGIPTQDFYPNIVSNIKERIANGMKPELVKPGLYRMVGSQVVHYWFGTSEKPITLGLELTRRPQAITVNFTGKNRELKNKPPYASDLYLETLVSSHTPIRLMSDTALSDEGLKIWKRLLLGGGKILVYDRENPGQSRELIKNLDDLQRYFSHGEPDFKRYQYALVLNGEMQAESIGIFNTRRYRELAGLSLRD